MSEQVINWVLGEDNHENEVRRLQDERWRNAVADGRVHLSHREFALKYAYEAKKAIEAYNIIVEFVELCYQTLNPFLLSIIVDYAFANRGLLVFSILERKVLIQELKMNRNPPELSFHDTESFQVCVRKRPLMRWEISEGCYDSCQILNEFQEVSTRSVGLKTVLFHDCKLARNGRQLNMTHKLYSVHKCYDSDVDNHNLCEEVVGPLLQWTLDGNNSTFICFGQTGTGKTYTLYGALEYVSTKLDGFGVEITYFEVHGKKCYDLFSQRKEVHLRSDEHDIVHVRGSRCLRIEALKRDQLMEILNGALALRSCETTERNPISSRSHAVCSLNLFSKEDLHPLGKITLVDLAGSERNYETVKMTAAQHRESADINFALMSLKDCLRAHHEAITTSSSPRIPYRASLLTRVLKECFSTELRHRTTIMATGKCESFPSPCF